MVESLQVSAQLTTVVEVDVTRIAGLRQRAKADFEAREGVKLSFLPFFAKAAVEALKPYPQVNASIDTEAGTVTYHEAEHLGIAVDTERGLLVPGDPRRRRPDPRRAGAQDHRPRRPDPQQQDHPGRAVRRDVHADEHRQPRRAVRHPDHQPAAGRRSWAPAPWSSGPVVVADPTTGADGIAIRSMVYFALTYDHRLVDGADAARFLVAVKQRLEDGGFESRARVSDAVAAEWPTPGRGLTMDR